MTHPIPIGTCVTFDIEDLVAGTAVVAEAEYDEGWAYRLSAVVLTTGDAALLQNLADVEADGSVWVCEHEVQALPVRQPAAEAPA
jgi:hypothetical protein